MNRGKELFNSHSEQYRKAWFSTFPPSLWPAVEEDGEDGMIILRLKNGARLASGMRGPAVRPEDANVSEGIDFVPGI